MSGLSFEPQRHEDTKSRSICHPERSEGSSSGCQQPVRPGPGPSLTLRVTTITFVPLRLCGSTTPSRLKAILYQLLDAGEVQGWAGEQRAGGGGDAVGVQAVDGAEVRLRAVVHGDIRHR